MRFTNVLALCCIVVINVCQLTSSTVLEQVDDTDLVHLLTGEDNVITLFTKSNCPKCDELESVVENIQNELKESLQAVVVKAHNSHMVTIYDPSKEPSLVYFRRGIPMLYYGEISEDEIIATFSDNRDPVVKELSDVNFEHLTQAASGATTGDWFVFFYSADCVFCQRLYAVWEAVGAKLRRRINVARLNRLEAGLATAKRFEVTASPEFILIRQGKVYRYKVKDFTPRSLINFAENGFRKQTHPEDVPPVPSLMNNFFEEHLQALANNPKYLMIGSTTLGIIGLLIIIFKIISGRPSTNKHKKARKTK